MPHTINGSINSAVWLEYSTNGGSTWTRLSTSFPIGTSITTGLLPINVDLKIRLIALCDETKISNVVDYDYVPPVTSYAYLFSINSGLTPSEACGFTNLSLNLYAAELSIPSVSILYSDSNLTTPFNGENKYRKHTYGANATACHISTDGTLLSFENLC
jgi:hypothetical protein